MNRFSVLSIEDDKAIRNLISITLESQDYRYYTAASGEEGLQQVAQRTPDVVLLDLGLPDMDGVEVIRRIRSWSNVPIIVISARSEDSDKIEALDAGADDYLTKPFSVDEMLARLRCVLRRINLVEGQNAKASSIFENGELKIDLQAGCAYLGDEEMHLTPIEYKLLVLLAQNEGKVLTHSYITKQVWGSSWESNVASLRVFMATLRRKLEKGKVSCPCLQTHVGIGYRMIKL